MKTQKTVIRGCIIVVALIAVVISCPLVAIKWWSEAAKSPIYKADLPQLLAECRTMMKERTKFSNINPNSDGSSSISPPSREWPRILQELKASYVIIREKDMVICIKAMPGTYLIAFDEGAKECGAEKLIEGLWYSRNPAADCQ